MSEAQAGALRTEARPRSPVAAANVVVAAVFAGAALLFTLYFMLRYTVWQNGHTGDVLFGLWGLYWGAALAWGALRIRPRERRGGVFHAFFWAAFAQGFFLVLGWGVMLFENPIDAVAYSTVAAFAVGPGLAVGFLFTSRRGLVLILAEVLGPALFWALHRYGG